MTSKVRRNGAYAPLGANYADDDAVTRLDVAENDRAELLYVRSLAYCARDPRTEGFVSQVALDAGRILRRSKGRKGIDTIQEAAQTLVDLGLWDRVDDGYIISSWLKWNKSWKEISGELATDAARKRRETRPDSTPPPGGIRTEADGSPPGLGAPNHVTSRHVTTEHKNTRSPAAPSSPLALVPADGRTPFDTWWDTYPRKVGKDAARKSYDRAVKRADPEMLLEAARRLAADPNLPEKRFIPHPSTWLNEGRWDDEPLPKLAPTVNRDAQGRICPPGQESLPTYERFRQVTL